MQAKATKEWRKRKSKSRYTDGAPAYKTSPDFRYERKGKQAGVGLKRPQSHPDWPARPTPGPFWFSYTKPRAGQYPYVTSLLSPPIDGHTGWQRKKFGPIGWFERPVMKLGRKIGRKSAYERRLWQCALFHFLLGYWPDDDPLGRHPNETGVLVDETEVEDPLGSWS